MPHYPGPIKQKLPHFGTTIFAIMQKLSEEFGAINLSQGFPDFPVSEELINLIHCYMRKGFNQYAPMIGIRSFYQKKRNYFLNLLSGSRFKFKPSSGSYFQLLDYSEITDEKDIDFAMRLTKEFRVASIPVSVFYLDEVDNKVLRICFAKKEETLERGAEILCKI